MKKLSYIIGLISMLLFANCTPSDQTVTEQRIYDNEGIVMTLEWNTGNGSEQAKIDANLDMIIEFRTKNILYSEWSNSFENLSLFSFYQDDTYYIKSAFIGGNKTVNYTLYVRGISDTLANDVRKFYGQMNVNQVGTIETTLRVTKKGNEYTLR